jgi:hypothetical protein
MQLALGTKIFVPRCWPPSVRRKSSGIECRACHTRPLPAAVTRVYRPRAGQQLDVSMLGSRTRPSGRYRPKTLFCQQTLMKPSGECADACCSRCAHRPARAVVPVAPAAHGLRDSHHNLGLNRPASQDTNIGNYTWPKRAICCYVFRQK